MADGKMYMVAEENILPAHTVLHGFQLLGILAERWQGWTQSDPCVSSIFAFCEKTPAKGFVCWVAFFKLEN